MKLFVLLLCFVFVNSAVIIDPNAIEHLRNEKGTDAPEEVIEVSKSTGQPESAGEIPISLQDVADLGSSDSASTTTIKEKRCPRDKGRVGMWNPYILQLQKRDTKAEQERKLCISCKRRTNCEVSSNCDECSHWCNYDADKIVGMGAPVITSRFSNNEDEHTYLRTVGAVYPGVILDMICRFLGIKEKDDIEKIFLIAKMKNNVVPEISQEAKATLKDDDNVLTDIINNKVQEAFNEKGHITPEEVDKIIEDTLAQLRSGSIPYKEPVPLGSRLSETTDLTKNPEVEETTKDNMQQNTESINNDNNSNNDKKPSLLDTIRMRMGRLNLRKHEENVATPAGQNRDPEIISMETGKQAPLSTISQTKTDDNKFLPLESKMETVGSSRQPEDDSKVSVKDDSLTPAELEDIKNHQSTIRDLRKQLEVASAAQHMGDVTKLIKQITSEHQKLMKYNDRLRMPNLKEEQQQLQEIQEEISKVPELTKMMNAENNDEVGSQTPNKINKQMTSVIEDDNLAGNKLDAVQANMAEEIQPEENEVTGIQKSTQDVPDVENRIDNMEEDQTLGVPELKNSLITSNTNQEKDHTVNHSIPVKILNDNPSVKDITPGDINSRIGDQKIDSENKDLETTNTENTVGQKAPGLGSRMIDSNDSQNRQNNIFENIRNKLKNHEPRFSKLGLNKKDEKEDLNKNLVGLAKPVENDDESKQTPRENILEKLIEKSQKDGKKENKLAQNILDKLRHSDPKDNMIERLKAVHEQNIQKQQELIKKHEEALKNHHNVLEGIRSKLRSNLPLKEGKNDVKKTDKILEHSIPQELDENLVGQAKKPFTDFGKNSEPAEISSNMLEEEQPKETFGSSLPNDPNTHDLNIVGKPNTELTSRSRFSEDILEDLEDFSNLGKIVTIQNETTPSNVYFLGNGVKLPLKMVHENDGTVQLSVDLDKMCSCQNSTCPKKRDIAEVVGTILEKEAELESELTPTSHHGVSAKITRSTDKLLKELQNAGFDVHQEIMFPMEQNSFKNRNSFHDQIKSNALRVKNIFGETVEKLLNSDEINLLKKLLSEEPKTTMKMFKQEGDSSRSLFEELLKKEIPEDRYREMYDEKIGIKPHKIRKLEKDLEALKANVEQSKKKTEILVKEGAKGIFKTKDNGSTKKIKEEVDLANNILGWMKSLAAKE